MKITIDVQLVCQWLSLLFVFFCTVNGCALGFSQAREKKKTGFYIGTAVYYVLFVSIFAFAGTFDLIF